MKRGSVGDVEIRMNSKMQEMEDEESKDQSNTKMKQELLVMWLCLKDGLRQTGHILMGTQNMEGYNCDLFF